MGKVDGMIRELLDVAYLVIGAVLAVAALSFLVLAAFGDMK